jgi:ubiquinone/menaquinone biosynthesis C-methylase UbiE
VLQGESEDWVSANLARLNLRCNDVLEIGSANGYRLTQVAAVVGATTARGIEPSAKAVAEGNELYGDRIELVQGTAESLPYPDNSFDLVLFGFCLYLVDREDLFRVASEAHRVLRAGGHIAIVDFTTPFPYCNDYRHLEGIRCYKMDYGQMFLWNPDYIRVFQTVVDHGSFAPTQGENVDNMVGLSVLQKRDGGAYVTNPFSDASRE